MNGKTHLFSTRPSTMCGGGDPIQTQLNRDANAIRALLTAVQEIADFAIFEADENAIGKFCGEGIVLLKTPDCTGVDTGDMITAQLVEDLNDDGWF
jgi:hypothetical protein